MYFKNATLKLLIISSLHAVGAKNIFNNGNGKGYGNGNNGNGNGNGNDGDDIVTTGEVKCVPYQVEALMASDVIGGPDEDGGAPVDEL